jgi:autotransporter translocation and assembly factor TamB
MKRFVIVLSILACFTILTAQTPQPTPAPQAGGTTPGSIKLPAARAAQLKEIQERQEALGKEYQALEAQKVIVAQRAALELHLTAEQVDSMDLTFGADGYVFKPKDKPKTPEKAQEKAP